MEKKSADKKVWKTPRLVRHGDVDEITKQGKPPGQGDLPSYGSALT